MGCDNSYKNHAEADQDDMDVLLTLLGAAGCNYIMGVPGADDIMLNYQSTSFHDALYLRSLLKLRPAPEFESWLGRMGIAEDGGRPGAPQALPPAFERALEGESRIRARGCASSPLRASPWAAPAIACRRVSCLRFSSRMRGRAMRCTTRSIRMSSSPSRPSS